MHTRNTASGYSALCTEFTRNLGYDDLPPAVVAQVKHSLLDWFGCVVQGGTQQQALPARALVRTMGGSPMASLVGEKNANSILNAALYHGYLGHIMGMDDVERFSVTHPGTVIFPAALAVGQWRKKSGREFIAAVVAGYEVMSRIGSAVSPAHYAIWHTTSTCGAFGAAMAAGKLFDLRRPALDWALGNAGTMAAGLWQYLQDGGMSKFLHPGRAAVNGTLAAYLASENFTGATRILEGSQGFFAGYARQDIDSAVFADLGSHYRTAEISIKPYPCCRHLHSAIDAASALYNAVDLDNATGISAETYSTVLQTSNIEDPQTALQAKFSLRFCIASALLEGCINDSSFTPEALKNPAVRQLMQRITVTVKPEYDRLMPTFWPSTVHIDCADGTRLSREILSPKGDPGNPVGWDGIKEKCRIMTRGVLSPAAVDTLAAVCADLESLPDVTALLDCINTQGNFDW